MAVSLLTNTSITPTAAINAQTGTTYTPVLSDGNNTLVTLTNASAITVTIPPNSSVAYPIGTILFFSQNGAGQVTFAQGSGVAIASNGATATAPKIRVQYSACNAIQTAANTWLIVGDLT
jgi:hypothetical protein